MGLLSPAIFLRPFRPKEDQIFKNLICFTIEEINKHIYSIFISLLPAYLNTHHLKLDREVIKKYNGEHMDTNKSKPMNSPLTKKQSDFFSFLKEYLQEKGYPPTVRETMQGLGLSSTNIVRKYLDILERKGYIRRQFNRPRAIEIVETVTRNLEFRPVPIVGRLQAGAPHPVIEDIEGYLSIDKSICRSNNTFLMRVVGDSMIDAHIQEGDLVLVKPQPVANNGDIVVAVINGEATVKRFYQKGDTIQLKPEHPTMKPITIKEGKADVHIVGKVITVIRQLEK